MNVDDKLHAQQKSHPRNCKQLERGNATCRLQDSMLAAGHRSLSAYVDTILRKGSTRWGVSVYQESPKGR